mmetsp:Transcript_123548/g.283315  ORF Transcript_123548/g.283315 Transcript_123548/m.283315 type:complete len:198 (+) Transcript_123548:1537-2130(+)
MIGSPWGHFDEFAPVARQQVVEVSKWMTMRLMRDQWNAHHQCCSTNIEFDKEFGDTAQNAASLVAMLLSHPKFRGVSAQDIEGSQRMVQSWVHKDRLPKENTMQRLKLLQHAWTYFDIMMHLANWYKRMSQILYQRSLSCARSFNCSMRRKPGFCAREVHSRQGRRQRDSGKGNDLSRYNLRLVLGKHRCHADCEIF